MKTLALVSLVLLLAGCAGSTVGYSGGDANTSGSAVGVMANEHNDGSNALDVGISLPDPPPVMPQDQTVDVAYVFDIKNLGASPAKIKRINLSSAGGVSHVERWSRTFKKTIEPGATEQLEFVARLTGIDPNLGVRGPTTLRAEIEFENADGAQKSTFIRNVGGAAAVGISNRP